MAGAPITAQRQFLVKATPNEPGGVVIEDYFATKTGGEVEGEVSTAWDGGKQRPDKLGGPAVPAVVTLSRPYRAERDAPLMKALRKRVNRDYYTVSVQPVDRDLVPLGVDPTIYVDALLVRAADPEHDAGSADPGTMELAFDPSDVE